jgi:unspecific monooxygenase
MAIADTQVIPGPRRRRIIGTAYDYERDPVAFLTEARNEYGDVFRLDRGIVVVCDPALVQHVLARTGQDFRAEAKLFNDPRRTDPDRMATFMRRKRQAWQALSVKVIAAHLHRLDFVVERSLAAMAGTEIDIVDTMRWLSARSLIDFCLYDAEPTLVDQVADASRATLAVIDRGQRLPYWFPSHRRRARADHGLHQGLAEAVRAAQDRPAAHQPRDFVDTLLAPGGNPLTPREATAVLSITLIGSHGVPGTALSWLMRELGLRQDIMARIRAEAAAHLAEAIRTGGMDQLTYTQAVVREVVRSYPPAWLLGREVIKPVELGDYQVFPGEQVLFSPYLMHHDPRWWTADPSLVDPDRWLGESQPHAPHAYIPFGAGPRVCVGARLGTAHMTLVAARLALGYDLELLNAEDVTPRFGGVLSPAGLRARIHSRAARETVGAGH